MAVSLIFYLYLHFSVCNWTDSFYFISSASVLCLSLVLPTAFLLFPCDLFTRLNVFTANQLSEFSLSFSVNMSFKNSDNSTYNLFLSSTASRAFFEFQKNLCIEWNLSSKQLLPLIILPPTNPLCHFDNSLHEQCQCIHTVHFFPLSHWQFLLKLLLLISNSLALPSGLLIYAGPANEIYTCLQVDTSHSSLDQVKLGIFLLIRLCIKNSGRESYQVICFL